MQEWKEKLTEVRILKSKALRRSKNFTEAYDIMFHEKINTITMTRQQLAKFNVRRADDFINPDNRILSLAKDFNEMADFWGRGKVTAKELHLCILCHVASVGLMVPTDTGFAHVS